MLSCYQPARKPAPHHPACYLTPPETRTAKVESVAYALQWSNYFNEWNFVRVSKREMPLSLLPEGLGREPAGDLGISVEGIRVESSSPGFRQGGVYAIANATGKAAPRTNVARSGLEDTPEYARLLHSIYGIYCDHVRAEMTDLEKHRSRSLTWAAGEGAYLIAPLRQSEYDRGPVIPESEAIFEDELGELAVYVIEEDGTRRSVSWKELEDREAIWTIESAFVRHAESLIREASVNISLRAILKSLEVGAFELPTEPLLCSEFWYRGSVFEELLSRRWEVGELRANREARRLDVRWLPLERSPRWVDPVVLPNGEMPEWYYEFIRDLEMSRPRRRSKVVFPVGDVGISGLDEEDAVKVGQTVYLLPSGTWRALLSEEGSDGAWDIRRNESVMAFGLASSFMFSFHRDPEAGYSFFSQRIEPVLRMNGWWERVDEARLAEAIRHMKWNLYDVWVWQRAAPISREDYQF